MFKKTCVKEDDSKKTLNIRLIVWVSVCVFVLGSILGFFTGDILQVKETSAEISLTDTPHAKQSGESTELSETEELEILKRKLVKLVKDRYPDLELSFAIKNLDTGACIFRNSKALNGASVIKLFIAGAVYEALDDGSYTLSEDRARDLRLMIAASNNQASCNFIDDFGGTNPVTHRVDDINKINQFIINHGFSDTILNRKMYDSVPPDFNEYTGLENYTSVEDAVNFLEALYNKSLFSEPYNTEFLKLLEKQQIRTKIPAKITEKYPEVTVANKTGELSTLENDMAIITSDKFNIIFAVMISKIPLKEDGNTDYVLKEKVQETIADMGLMVVDYYSSKK